MLKLASLLLVATVAISWSQVDATPRGLWKALAKSVPYKRAAPYALAARKRSAEDKEIDEIVDLSGESEEKIMRRIVAGVLVMSLDSSEEQNRLEEKLRELLDQEWDSLDDFEAAAANAYEEVTGMKPDEVDDSDAFAFYI